MSRKKKPFNPFYPLLLVVGVLFAITASCYGVMTISLLNPAGVEESGRHPLIAFMDQHGVKLMMTEILLLALATFAAMGTDSYWIRRVEQHDRDS